ncbi:cytochrome c biogenesis CcdA family protein [uncultured Jatrophihabitans sp.]|uniref:cytochrome c biogenesis CcdA family protein n=1 Tax=uncultured Jatrophihabitans sp. TaxID=1610747 RepID=UPI0035CB5160
MPPALPLAAGGFAHTVTDGPLLAAAGVAALVGVIGFLSPCVLPLVPGYLSYVAGLSGEAAKPSQRRMVVGALLFVCGFTAIFVVQGLAFGAFGSTIRAHTVVIERVLGGVTIVMGLAFLGGIPFLQREWRVRRLPKAGLLGAPLLGVVFGLAWAPCLTPTFGTVNALAYTQGSAGRGAFLQACYCLGLGIPFVLVALGFGWVARALGFVRRHLRAVSMVGGGLLIVIGVLLVTGEWNTLMDTLRAKVGAASGFEV